PARDWADAPRSPYTDWILLANPPWTPTARDPGTMGRAGEEDSRNHTGLLGSHAFCRVRCADRSGDPAQGSVRTADPTKGDPSKRSRIQTPRTNSPTGSRLGSGQAGDRPAPP